MQGHVLIADWSVAHFVVIMNDVMNDNMAAFAHYAFGCFLLLDQMFRKQCTVRQYTYHSNLSDQSAREISVRIMVRLRVALF